MALARERVEYHGETLELPLPDGPGKALKLMISPVQERIPIYLAAIGPKNTRWPARSPTAGCRHSSPPSTWPSSRALLEEGAARRAARSTTFDIAPNVNSYIDDDREPRPRRDAARCSRCTSAAWARASRTSTTTLVQRYGFEDAAKEVQDLYLDGKKEEAAAALPGELIDMVVAVRPARRRRATGSRRYRDAGRRAR